MSMQIAVPWLRGAFFRETFPVDINALDDAIDQATDAVDADITVMLRPAGADDLPLAWLWGSLLALMLALLINLVGGIGLFTMLITQVLILLATVVALRLWPAITARISPDLLTDWLRELSFDHIGRQFRHRADGQEGQVLIVCNLADRLVRLFANPALSRAVPPQVLATVNTSLERDVSQGALQRGLSYAIASCGKLFRLYFRRQQPDHTEAARAASPAETAFS